MYLTYKEKEDIKEATIAVVVVWLLIGIVSAIMALTGFPDDFKRGECKYQSIAGITNPWYFVTCELFRRHFNLP